LGQLGNIKSAFVDTHNELQEMGRINPGNEVFQVLRVTPKVEIGKSGENNEIMRRRIWVRQFRVEFKADDAKVLKLGC